MSYPIVIQKQKFDCGPACICMICKFYNISINLEVAFQIANTNENGTSIWHMQKALKIFDFQTAAIRIKNFSSNYDFSMPTIAVIGKLNTKYHYIVIYKKSEDNLIIGDPNKGLNKINIIEFLKTFTEFLIIPKK